MYVSEQSKYDGVNFFIPYVDASTYINIFKNFHFKNCENNVTHEKTLIIKAFIQVHPPEVFLGIGFWKCGAELQENTQP